MYDEWGIADGYHDVGGTWHDTSEATRRLLQAAIAGTGGGAPVWFVAEGDTPSLLGPCHLAADNGDDLGETHALPDHLPIGYHRLTPLDGGPATTLVVHPARCPEPPAGWGVAAQVYSMWRRDGWGIGDFRDVALLGQQIAALGGKALLLSPLHAPAPTFPQEDSPYFPSSRSWLNPLLIPLAGEPPPSVDNSPGGTIDRSTVWRAKRQALAGRFANDSASPLWRAWASTKGQSLWRYSTWNALADRHGHDWRRWPEAFRHPDNDAVRDLPLVDRTFAEACEFHAWCQWLAATELAATASASGLALIGDLAVGCSPDGADSWLHQDLMALDVSIGAPPDPFNAAGQTWTLPPFVPAKLRAAAYAPFVEMVRAGLNGVSGLRIDHVMGLFRQFWIPAGCGPAEGAYVRLPADELLAIIRIEATRASAFVIGEDLGTVQPEVHDAMRSGHVLGTKVWWFDQVVGNWPVASLGTVTTHDLPTIAGVWQGTDGTPEMRAALIDAAPNATTPLEAAVAVHQLVASSPAQLVLASIDDLAGATERPNHPGTYGPEHLNWRRRLSTDSGHILGSESSRAILTAFQRP